MGSRFCIPRLPALTMKGAITAAASLVLLGSSQAAEVTPVQKVIQLMNGMAEKGKKEKHDEQVQFAAYKQFCDDTTVEKKRDIAEAEEKIEVLKADIAKYTADSQRLTKEIAGHDKDIANWKRDTKAATQVRGLEKGDYDALHKDYSESVDALQRAIAVLKKQAHDRPQAKASLLQVKSQSLIPDEAKRAIDMFIQESDPEGLAVSAPEAHGYEFQSQGVIDMLEKLLDKFIDERTAAEKEEMNSKHSFEMLMQDLTAQIEQSTQDRTEKAEAKAKALQARADANGDLKDTTSTMEADKKYMGDLTATCEQKGSDFESRQQLRAEELEAIAKAIEIISSGAVSGNADKYLPKFVQTHSSFAQLRSGTTATQQERAAEFLRKQAGKLNSRVLSALAGRVSDDPFAKVKKMLKDLLVRLMEEANEEAEHKGWCDTELSTNEQTRKEKTDAVETLHAEIDQLEASIAKLTEDINELTKAVADLNEAMAVATAQKEYDTFMTDSKVDVAAKETDIEHKTAKKQDEEQALNTKKNDLEGTQKELDAALAYFDKLKPSCVDSGVSYEDRVAR